MTPKASARIRRILLRESGLAMLLLVMLAGARSQAQVATTVKLTISNNSPSYTTPSAPGASAALSPIVLTATVTETVSGKPVTGGTVTFFDLAPLDRAKAADPIGATSIQGAPYVTPAGQAQLYYDLGAGQHNFTATYNGTSGSASTPNWLSSSTAAALEVFVNGQAQSTAVTNLVGADGSFILYDPGQPIVSGDLYVYGYGMQYPSGTASFYDNTTNTLYAQPAGTTVQELYASLGQTIQMDAPIAGVTSFILADPFQAGVPTIVAFYAGANAVYTIDINRKQAGGTAASATGCAPCSVAGSPMQGVAVDVNNDGLQDLVIAHNDTSAAGVGVGVLMNTLAGGTKAYGSAEVTYTLGHPIAEVAVGDVNGDGFPDIVALTADNTNLMLVLLNDGTGHFTQQATTFTGGNGATHIALGDFNKDGRLDLAVLNSLDDTVGILLGNGNATFQAMTAYTATPPGIQGVPQAFTVGRYGNNGALTANLDIGVVNSYNYNQAAALIGTLGYYYTGGTVLFGNGDGTFATKFYSFGFGDFGGVNSANFTGLVSQMQFVDIDGDGIPDVAMSFPNGNFFSPEIYDVPDNSYEGEDGYPQTGVGATPPVNYASVGLGVGDVNGDGLQDYVLMSADNSALYPGNPAKGSITIFLNTLYSQDQIPALIAAPGSHSIAASYAPATGSIYAPVTTPPVVVTVPNPGIATFSPNPVNFGTVAVGSTGTQTLTITNTGTGPLKIPSDYLSNTGGGLFGETGDTCVGITLQPGDPPCTITLQFTPTAAGFQSGALQVTDTQVGSPQTVTVEGTGGTAAPAGSNIGTTIVLTSSNLNPPYTTPAMGGTATPLNPVTLTATVTVTATGVPVVGGSVTFYDNVQLSNTVGPSPIGTANVQFPVNHAGGSNGIATLTFAFGPGPHTLTATYSGTAVGPPAYYSYAPSTTANPISLNSSGSAAEEMLFVLEGAQGTIGYYDPQSSPSAVYSNPNQDPTSSNPGIFGFGIQVPTGTATVTDQTTGIVYPMTPVPAYVNRQFPIYDPQLTVYDQGGYAYGNYVYSLGFVNVTNFFTADIFQSGVPALITLNSIDGIVGTSNLYSNPNEYPGCSTGGPNPTCVVSTPPVQGVAADVNGDGRLDLVIAHNDGTGNGSVGIFFNTLNLAQCVPVNDCGAFHAAEVTYATGHPANNVQVGDVNGDGFPDIVATSSDGSNIVSILLNNGDGTYTVSPNTFVTGNGVSQLALGDFNQDGTLDIAVLNKTDQNIGILLGNGDGTFNAMTTYSVGTAPTAFAVADLNRDGFLDFAITNNDSPTQAEVSFLYGGAGGTFSYVSNLALYSLNVGVGFGYPETNPQPTSITATDLDGDGYPDLVIGFNVNTFTWGMYNQSLGYYELYDYQSFLDEPNGINIRTVSTVAVDLDGDGVKDLLFMPTVNNNLSQPNDNNLMVRFNGAMAYEWTGPDVVDSPMGNHTFVANYTPSGNTIYTPAVSGPITVDITAEPIVSLTPSTLSFPMQAVNSVSPPLTLTLANTGNGNLTNIAFSIYGQNPASPGGFTLTNVNCPTTLAGGAAPCTVNVTFDPASASFYSGYVLLTYGSGQTVYVYLGGQGFIGQNVNVNETVHLTDTVSAATATMVRVNETIVLTDAVSASLGHPITVNETVHLTDTVTASKGMSVNVNESVHLTDTVSAATMVVINDVESIHVTDVDTPLLSVSIKDVESIHVTDVDAALLSVSIADLETIHVTDTPATSVSSYNDATKLSVSATTVAVGGSVTLTATVMESGTATIPTGTVNFYDGGTKIGSGTVSGGMASYTEANLSSGTHTLSAVYLGNSVFPSSTSASVQVTTSSQTILTVTPNNLARNFGVANPALAYGITGFTGGDTIAVVTGTASLSTTAALTSPAGSYPITATAGSLGAPAKYVFSFASGTLTVNGNAAETITFATLPNVSLAAVPHETLTAHSTSGSLGQPITYSVTGPATISANVLTLTGTGTVTVTAMQAGNSTFAAAANVARTFTVTP